MEPSALEKTNLEAHVDLCQHRYLNLESRLLKIEEKVEQVHTEIVGSNKSLTRILIGTAGTVIAGLLSTIVVILIAFV